MPPQYGEGIATHIRVRRAEVDLPGWATRIQLGALRDALGAGLAAHAEGGESEHCDYMVMACGGR